MISLVIISFILEGIISLYMPFSINQLNLFYPQLVLVSFILIYPFYKSVNKYFMVLLIVGLIYDLVFTDTLILHSFLFFITGLVINEYYQKTNNNKPNFILLTVIIIFLYNSLYYLLLILFKDIDFSLYSLFYKISHSLILNIIYGYIFYIILRLNKQKIHKLKV